MSEPRPEAEPSDADLEAFAAMTFEPWSAEPGQWKPPSNTEWSDLGKNLLPGLRMGWKLLHRTKSELVQMMAELDDEARHALLDHLDYTERFFRAMLSIAETAEARALCALAATAGDGERGASGPRGERPSNLKSVG